MNRMNQARKRSSPLENPASKKRTFSHSVGLLTPQSEVSKVLSLEDSDDGTPKPSDEPSDHGVLVRSGATLNPSRVRAIPWAQQWPDLVDFYFSHAPDFTGLGIYEKSARYPDQYAILAVRSPENFTTQVLLAESARAYDRVTPFQLSWLLVRSIEMMNICLRDPQKCLSEDMAAAVLAMAIYSTVFGSPKDATMHVAGLRQILTLRGGLETMDWTVRNMCIWVDALNAFHFQAPRFFEAEERRYQGQTPYHAAHPLRLALLPEQSNLPPWRIRNQHLVSFAGPEQHMLHALQDIYHLDRAVNGRPYIISPLAARIRGAQIEERLLQFAHLPDDCRLTSPIFSDVDRENYDIVLELVRRCALVMLSRVLTISDPSAITHGKLDHTLMSLQMLHVNMVVQRYPQLACWVLCIRASFSQGQLRKRDMSRILPLLEQLHLSTLEDLRALMDEILYCEDALGPLLARLFEEVQCDLLT